VLDVLPKVKISQVLEESNKKIIFFRRVG
jgi:hypothetical protein